MHYKRWDSKIGNNKVSKYLGKKFSGVIFNVYVTLFLDYLIASKFHGSFYYLCLVGTRQKVNQETLCNKNNNSKIAEEFTVWGDLIQIPLNLTHAEYWNVLLKN